MEKHIVVVSDAKVDDSFVLELKAVCWFALKIRYSVNTNNKDDLQRRKKI